MKKLFISIFAIFLIAQSVTAQEETGTNMRFEVNKNSQMYFKDGDHYVVFRDDNFKGFFEPVGLYNITSGKIAGPGYEEPTWYEKLTAWYIGFFFDDSLWLNLIGLIIIIILLITAFLLALVAVVSFVHLIEYGGVREEHGVGVIIDGDYDYFGDEDDDDDEENDQEDDSDDAEESGEEETTDDEEADLETEEASEGEESGFRFEIEVDTGNGKKSDWFYVSSEIYDKYDDGQQVSVIYKIGRFGKGLYIIDVPLLNQ